jgi:serine protease Do
VVAAPVYALRGFLMKTPATAVAPAPWLGLGGAPSEAGNVRGVRVVGVAPGSPAEKAGLKAGDNADIIVAVDGKPVESAEQLAEAISKHSIGQTVKLLVFSNGAFREAQATLKAAPTP